jgi:nicotinamidase-related amidase
MKATSFVSISTCVLALLAAFSVHAETQKPQPQTLLKMFGAKSAPNRLSESVLIVIDAQREYVDGKLPLDGIGPSLKEASLLLERARKAGTPVIHVVHKAKPGSPLFNPDGPYVEIAQPVAPKPGETVVAKTLPNAFAGTTLEEQLLRTGRKKLVVIGYMTHMCLSATVRAAVDRGYSSTIVASGTATRDLPATEGGIVPAKTVQSASLAALADRFAIVVPGVQNIPE